MPGRLRELEQIRQAFGADTVEQAAFAIFIRIFEWRGTVHRLKIIPQQDISCGYFDCGCELWLGTMGTQLRDKRAAFGTVPAFYAKGCA
jgi:hypothetical protein